MKSWTERLRVNPILFSQASWAGAGHGWLARLSLTSKKDVRSAHSISPSMYDSANPMSPNRITRIQNSFCFTVNVTQGPVPGRRGEPAPLVVSLRLDASAWSKTCLVSAGSSTQIKMPFSIWEKTDSAAGCAVESAGSHIRLPSLLRALSMALESGLATSGGRDGHISLEERIWVRDMLGDGREDDNTPFQALPVPIPTICVEGLETLLLGCRPCLV